MPTISFSRRTSLDAVTNWTTTAKSQNVNRSHALETEFLQYTNWCGRCVGLLAPEYKLQVSLLNLVISCLHRAMLLTDSSHHRCNGTTSGRRRVMSVGVSVYVFTGAVRPSVSAILLFLTISRCPDSATCLNITIWTPLHVTKNTSTS